MKSALRPRRFHVIIPCHNCRQYISPCLESLLAQTFQPWQALVADDASDDGTKEAVAPYLADPRVRYRRLPERAWLMGNTLEALRSLDLAPNDVVAILDGDDQIRPHCLQRLWEKHHQGFDLVYTDEEIQGLDYSIGAPLLATVPVRKQTWRFSQLRSFKPYLFLSLPDETFRDSRGRYFRAAGDLSLYLPMAELAGCDKICFIAEKLYYYRVHDNCNFKVLRQEQLDNNWEIRSRPPLQRQTAYFDFIVTVGKLDKSTMNEFAAQVRMRYPRPFTVCIEHRLATEEKDFWRAYHGLWIEDGVFLRAVENNDG